MNFNKKEWTDRQVEFPDRRIITDTTTGESFTADITRDEGTVIKQGDLLDAFNLNDLENRIEKSVNSKSVVSVIPTLTEGTKIADITINAATTSLFAPAGSGGGATDQAILDISSEITNDLTDPDYSNHYMYLQRSYWEGKEIDPEEATYSDLIMDDIWFPGEYVWLIVTTYLSTDYLEVTNGTRDTEKFRILLTKTGVMQDQFIYLPGKCNFRIYHSIDHPPVVRSPAGDLILR